MRQLLMIGLIVIFSSSFLYAQINPDNISHLWMSSDGNPISCGSMEFVQYRSLPIYFLIVPIDGFESQGARFRITYEGPEGYLFPLGFGYTEELVASFEGTDIFEGVDVMLNQCISDPTIIFCQYFVILGAGGYEVNLGFDEHLNGGLGIYNCDPIPVLHQVCTFRFQINNDDYRYGCYYDCPTVGTEESTWGVIKTIYRD